MPRPATITADDLIDAAERVVASGGGAALTFDAVAREAGVSKGAVLHHFPTKDALIKAMIERLAGRIARPASEAPAGRGELVRAHVSRATETPGDRDPVSATLLAAVARDVELLAPLRAAARTAIEGLAGAGVPADRAAVLHLALDGLWISELLGISPLEGEERAHVIAAIERIALEDDR